MTGWTWGAKPDGTNGAHGTEGTYGLFAVAAPEPDEGVGEGLVEDFAVAVAGGFAEDEALVVAFGLEGSGGALAGHDPIVIGLLGVLGAEVILGDVGEDAEGLALGLFDELHAGVVFPGAQGEFGFLGGVVVLL